MLIVERIVCGVLDVNAYVVHREGEQACFVVDPAASEPVLAYMDAQNLYCTHILLTHGHFDHIGGTADIKAQTGATICIHENDADMLHDDTRSLAVMANLHIKPSTADHTFAQDELFIAAGIRVQVLHTPGHTPGGVCYVCLDDSILFSGDTLFRMSVGRADFPGASNEQLYASIIEKLFALPKEYAIYPGHMRSTTLDFERVRNPVTRLYRGNQW